MKCLIYRSSPEQRSMLLTLTAGIEYIARVICRREIEEARERIVMKGRRCFYNPSREYMMARMGYFKPKTQTYGRIIGKSPFREDNQGEGQCHLHNISV